MSVLEPVDIKCPECKEGFAVTVEDIAGEKTVSCPRGHAIDLKDEGHGAREAIEMMKNLDKSLKGFGGTTTIKF